MGHGHRTQASPGRRHAGRPGPWAQVPMVVLGMLFVAALLLSGYQRTVGGQGGGFGDPAGKTAQLENPVPGSGAR